MGQPLSREPTHPLRARPAIPRVGQLFVAVLIALVLGRLHRRQPL